MWFINLIIIAILGIICFIQKNINIQKIEYLFHQILENKKFYLDKFQDIVIEECFPDDKYGEKTFSKRKFLNRFKVLLDKLEIPHYQKQLEIKLKEYLMKQIQQKMLQINYTYQIASFLQSDGYNVTITNGIDYPCADMILQKENGKFIVRSIATPNNVDENIIEETYSAIKSYNLDGAYIITNSPFTSKAIELAKNYKITLRVGPKINNSPKIHHFK